MKITIKRIRKKTKTIDSQVYIDGMHICDSAENAKTAIKAGTYPIAITKCKQHARKMPIAILHKDICPACVHCPLQESVNNNTKMPVLCPQIKPGNGVYHRTDGSIIVGTYIAPGCLARPKVAFDSIYDRIRKNVERGNKVILVIEENYPKYISPFEMGTQILAQIDGI